ncbi:hypothetical protein ACM66B_006683 [Microbotryomycetes sp. NB124-2]
MDFLKAQIDSKKRALESVAPSNDLPSSKYIKTQDLDRIRSTERDFAITKQSRAASKTTAAAIAATDSSTAPALQQQQQQLDGSNHSNRRSASPATTTTIAAQAVAAAQSEQQQQGDKFNISNDEAIKRLRHKGQPIRLFGETDRDRRLRLRALELIEERTEGQRNEFQRAMDAVGAGMTLEEVARQTTGGAAAAAAAAAATVSTTAAATTTKNKITGKAADAAATSSTTTADSDNQLATKDGAQPNPKDQDVLVDLSLVKSNPHKVYPQIYHAIKRVLREWEQSLADRPEAVRRSTQGKIAAATQQTSAEYLKPLFKSLRKRELEPDVLRNIAEITHYMQKREYLRANDAYLRLSIGNAPWPIGVTMVGIHERAGRERVSTSNIAHALNDETSRKYIQSLKRLLTFAQSVRPPEDLSQLMG